MMLIQITVPFLCCLKTAYFDCHITYKEFLIPNRGGNNEKIKTLFYLLKYF